MRRRVLTVLSVLTVLAGVISPWAAQSAGAAPPPRIGGGTVSGPIPQPAPPADDPAGSVCAFPLHEDYYVNHVVGYTYTNAAGRVVAEYFTGALFVRLTRPDTGKSVTANLSGDGLETFSTDGSSTLYGVGPFSVNLHPGDTPGPFYAVLHGVSAVKLYADGHKEILFSSRVDNACAELS